MFLNVTTFTRVQLSKELRRSAYALRHVIQQLHTYYSWNKSCTYHDVYSSRNWVTKHYIYKFWRRMSWRDFSYDYVVRQCYLLITVTYTVYVILNNLQMWIDCFVCQKLVVEWDSTLHHRQPWLWFQTSQNAQYVLTNKCSVCRDFAWPVLEKNKVITNLNVYYIKSEMASSHNTIYSLTHGVFSWLPSVRTLHFILSLCTALEWCNKS